MTQSRSDRFRVSHEGADPWLWFIGFARIGLLAFLLAGTLMTRTRTGAPYLFSFYVVGFACSLWHLVSLRRTKGLAQAPMWVLVAVDFAVVAATVYFTGGVQSFFSFLFVIVVLEAGLLLGLGQSFIFATVASLFALAQTLPEEPFSIGLWYDFSIQCLAFYLTAFISGYWSRRIRRLQQFQHEILDNMNSGFLITDRNGVVSVQNKAADTILGFAPGDAIGRPAEEVLKTESSAECPILVALRSQRDFVSYEFDVVTRKNERKLLGLSTNRIYDHRSELTGLIASFSDLTEMARMRQELQRQDRMVVVGELAAELAHEIRNPVAAIRGAVDELRSDVASPEIAKKLGAIIIRESDHLDQIVAGFLDFARHPSVRREMFDLRSVLSEVGTLLQQQCRSSDGFSVHTEFPEHPCCVSGDPSQIKQVFVNLGKNAFEAMDGRGALSVTIIPVRGSYDIRFEDDGPGIEPDELARIFEPFYTAKKGGVGMGLAVCLRIVTAHDGTIRATPREGGGACLSVRLPAAQTEE